MRFTSNTTIAVVATLAATACGAEIDSTNAALSPAACEIVETTIPPSQHATQTQALTSANGRVANGKQIQGLSFNAIGFNALSLNGRTTNALSLNGRQTNALSLNGRMSNALSLNGLPANGLPANGLPANGLPANGLDVNIVDSADGRQFMKYAVGCMLTPEQTVTLTASDGGEFSYTGALGLAPQWTARALDETEQSWLSACMLAHVNAFGIKVPISARAGDLIDVEEGEEEAFPMFEGAFFGDLANGEHYSCQGTDTETAMALSPYRRDRVCTDFDETCGIESVGMCADVCATHIPGRGYSDCEANGTVFAETVNVYLHTARVFAACELD